jgi:hypothetical protein
MPLPTNCPKCSFKLAPMVYIPADTGNTTNVLHCMNCGWAVEITPEDAAALNALAAEGVSLNDHQWQILLMFMSYFIAPRSSGVSHEELTTKINQELAAINVRLSNPTELLMPSVPEGLDLNSSPSSQAPAAQLDLEQGSSGS